jgi:hypothetical protein
VKPIAANKPNHMQVVAKIWMPTPINAFPPHEAQIVRSTNAQ